MSASTYYQSGKGNWSHLDSPMKLSHHCSVEVQKENRMLVIIGERTQKKQKILLSHYLHSGTFKHVWSPHLRSTEQNWTRSV